MAATTGHAIRYDLRKVRGAKVYVVLGNPFVFYTIVLAVYYNIRVAGMLAIRMGECRAGAT